MTEIMTGRDKSAIRKRPREDSTNDDSSRKSQRMDDRRTPEESIRGTTTSPRNNSTPGFSSSISPNASASPMASIDIQRLTATKNGNLTELEHEVRNLRGFLEEGQKKLKALEGKLPNKANDTSNNQNPSISNPVAVNSNLDPGLRFSIFEFIII